MSENYLYLKLLLRNNLLLNLDEYALSNVAKRGLVCQFLGMNLASAFQPIANAVGKIVGHEALLRASLLEHGELRPETAFDDAILAERLVQFDRLVRTLHLLNHSRNFADHELLFLNVHPQLLPSVNDHGHTFEQILHYYAVPTSQVVIEIKHAAVVDPVQLAQAIQNYRKLGYKIAVDDFGSAQSRIGRAVHPQQNWRNTVEDNHALNQVLALRPDIVKLNRAVIHAAAQHRSADSVLTEWVNTFHQAGIQVAIEGIETSQQLEIAKQTGADFLQGYYLGQPAFSNIPDSFAYPERLAA